MPKSILPSRINTDPFYYVSVFIISQGLSLGLKRQNICPNIITQYS